MKKTTALKIINPIVAIVFIIQAGSGIFHDSIPYEIFRGVHGLTGYVLTVAVAVHVYFNWSWIVTTFLRKKTKG